MKLKYNKKIGGQVIVPETAIEAVEHLERFLNTDMWYAIHSEMKSEEDLLKYLYTHFEVCKNHIKGIGGEKE